MLRRRAELTSRLSSSFFLYRPSSVLLASAKRSQARPPATAIPTFTSPTSKKAPTPSEGEPPFLSFFLSPPVPSSSPLLLLSITSPQIRPHQRRFLRRAGRPSHLRCHRPRRHRGNRTRPPSSTRFRSPLGSPHQEVHQGRRSWRRQQEARPLRVGSEAPRFVQVGSVRRVAQEQQDLGTEGW